MTVFADSSYFVGLMLPGDQYHARAKALAGTIQSLVTTQFVLTEVAASFARLADRPRFHALVVKLEADPDVRVIPADDALFRDGADLYYRRPDKEWSLTDCTSFVVMEREQIREALTADHHFEQAGFVALMRGP